MKQLFAIAVLALAAGLAVPAVTGCHKTAPPAWALTAPERTVGDIIASANAAVVQYEKDQADCAATPTLSKCPSVANPTLHATMSRIQQVLAVAQPGYDVWAAQLKANPNAPEPADLAGAITAIQALLAQLPSLTN